MNIAEKEREEKLSREEYLYHNTELLLKKYRDVVWSIEVSTMQAKMNFQSELNCPLEEFLDMAYSAGADLSGTDIEEQMRVLERNKKMLEIIDTSLSLLKKRQGDGEELYWILYYTYLSDSNPRSVDDIIEMLNEKMQYISLKTYYTKRKKAISILSDILWGFTSKGCSKIIKEFF